jgi:prepilin-type N-terminal cleavage/methylation domain-containing protein
MRAFAAGTALARAWGKEEELPMDEKRRWRRRRLRGVSLVEVLIVVAIMSIIAGMAVFVAFPELKKARVRTAKMGALAVAEAAETYRQIDHADDPACPTVQQLIEERKLDAKRVKDPWGSRYTVGCEDEETHGISLGRDRTFGTPDDVRDDLPPERVESIARM